MNATELLEGNVNTASARIQATSDMDLLMEALSAENRKMVIAALEARIEALMAEAIEEVAEEVAEEVVAEEVAEEVHTSFQLPPEMAAAFQIWLSAQSAEEVAAQAAEEVAEQVVEEAVEKLAAQQAKLKKQAKKIAAQLQRPSSLSYRQAKVLWRTLRTLNVAVEGVEFDVKEEADLCYNEVDVRVAERLIRRWKNQPQDMRAAAQTVAKWVAVANAFNGICDFDMTPGQGYRPAQIRAINYAMSKTMDKKEQRKKIIDALGVPQGLVSRTDKKAKKGKKGKAKISMAEVEKIVKAALKAAAAGQ